VVYKNMTNSIIAALAQRIPELEAIVGRALLMLLLGYRRPRMLPKRHNTLRLPHFFGRALTPHRAGPKGMRQGRSAPRGHNMDS